MPLTRRASLLAVAGLVASGLAAVPLPGAVARASVAPGLVPQLPVVTRMSDSASPGWGVPATVGVRVGTRTPRAYWAPWPGQTCRAVLWLVAVDRSTGATVFDDNGTGGIIASLCDPGGVRSAVARIVALGTSPVVVVNTLTWPQAGCGSYRDPTLGSDLAPLGFTAEPNALDVCTLGLTGLGSPGLGSGDAWQEGVPTSADVAAGPPGVLTPTIGAITGALVPNSDRLLHFVCFDATVARTYTDTGSGGWEVDGTRYAAAGYPGAGAGPPPDGRGGVQVVALRNVQTAPGAGASFGLVWNRTFWTDSGVAATDATAWHALAQGLAAGPGLRDGFLLLRTVGTAKAAPTLPPAVGAAAPPETEAAWQVDRLWGQYESVLGLRDGSALTIAFPGGTSRGSGAVVTYSSAHDPAMNGVTTATPPAHVPLTFQTGDRQGDPTHVEVLLQRTHVGYWYQPVQGAGGTAGSYEQSSVPAVDPSAGPPLGGPVVTSRSTFAVQRLLARPDSAWPMDAHTPGPLGAAYRDWALRVCQCADAASDPRQALVSGYFGAGWNDVNLSINGHAARTYGSTAAYTLLDWQRVADELYWERTFAEQVWGYYQHLTQLEAAVVAAGPAALAAVTATMQAQLAKDAGLSLAAENSTLMWHALALGVVVGFSDISKVHAVVEDAYVSEVVTTALAGFVGWLYITDKGEAESPRFDSTVGDLAGWLAARAADGLTGAGVEVERILTDHDRLFSAGYQLWRAHDPADPWFERMSPAGEASVAVRALQAGLYKALLSSFYQVWSTSDGRTGPDYWGPASYFWNATARRWNLAFSALPGPRVRSGMQYLGAKNGLMGNGTPESEPADLLPGPWYDSAIARFGISPHMTPPSDALLTAVQAGTGASLPEILRQWPLRHVGCATGYHPAEPYLPLWSGADATTWSHPDVCEPPL